MERTFTSASDDALIALIESARHRLAVIAPGLTTPVAEALVARMTDMPSLALTIILDADPEVYRMGYGDVEALSTIRTASAAALFDLREQPGIRIGVVISDDRTMIFAPVSRNVEAGSTSPDHPNAIFLEGDVTEKLAAASGAPAVIELDAEVQEQEIGDQALAPKRVEAMVADLKAKPPRPFDLSRRLTVFTSEVQYAEVKMTNTLFSARTITLHADFKKIVDEQLRSGIKASLKIPVDPKKAYKINVGGKETLVSEDYLKRERASLEAAFLYDWKARGKVIFRADRENFKAKLNDFIALTKLYQEAVKADLERMRKAFCKQMVEEFFEHWQTNTPARLRHRDKTDDPSLIADIEAQAKSMFDGAIEMGPPELKVVYKDISIEDLRDAAMMETLKDLMEKARVPAATIAKLFSKDEAVGAGKGRTA